MKCHYFVFVIIVWAGCYSPLLGYTRYQDWCWAAIWLSHHQEQLDRADHEVDGLDIGGQHVGWLVLLYHTYRPQRRPYTTVQAGAKITTLVWRWLNWTTAVLGRVNPGGWVPELVMIVQRLAVLSNHSTFHRWYTQSTAHMLLFSDKLMGCAASTNGCLNLRRRVFALSGQVNAEWSRCSGSMTQCARDSVAPLWRTSAVSRLDAWEDRKVFCWCRMQASSHKFGRCQWSGCEHFVTRQEYSTRRLNGPGVRWLLAALLLQHPSQSQQAASRARHAMSTSCKVTCGVGNTWATCPMLLPGVWVWSRWTGFCCCG